MSITKYISTGFEVGESFGSPIKTADWQPERYVPPEIEEFVHSLEPDPRFSYVHLIAMTDGDWYGQNLNGDIFDEDQLLGLQSQAEALKNQGDLRGVPIPRYQTFQQARFYRKHRNSPNSPFYGDVLCVAWNQPMRRVELIVRIAKEAIPEMGMEKAPDIVIKLDRRGFITVSMGCFSDPTTPICTSRGYVPISDIKVGDLVATHRGRWRPVTELHRRRYTGPLATVWIKGLPRPLLMTADHPLLAQHRKADVADTTARLYQRKWAETGTLAEVETAGWSRVASLKPLDLLFHPKITETSGEVGLSVEQARLLAFYLADGNLSHNPTGASTVVWTVNKNNPACEELCQLGSMLAGKSPVEEPVPGTTEAVRVRLYHSDTARWVEGEVGRGGPNKRLPVGLWGSAVETRLAFIGAWMACDGFRDYKGCHISTAVESLALSLRDLLFSCGISSTIHRIQHPQGRGFNTTDTVEYVVSIQRDQAVRLVPWCYKLAGLEAEVAGLQTQTPHCKPLTDGNFSSFVTSVEWTMVSDIEVYNFEVEDDESYLAAGVISHNCNITHETCSYCNATNQFIKDRCSHLKNQMGQIMPNGVRVGARNYGMRFFDISDVDIPADDTAFSLQKVAGLCINEAFDTLPELQKAAWVRKWADIKKQISLQQGCLGEITPKPAKTGEMQAFSTNELEAMLKAASGDLDTVLSTAALAAVVFQPAELMHLTKVACGDAEDFSGFEAVSLDKFSLAVYHAIRPKIASRSCFAAPCPAAGWEPAKVAEQGFPELADYYRFYRDAINCLPKQSFIKAAMRIGPLQGLHGGDLAKIDAGVRGLVHAGMADDNLPPSP